MNKMRNFNLHISPAQKERLKSLAEASNMTLTRYIEEVLNDAVANKNWFKAYKVSSTENPEMKSVPEAEPAPSGASEVPEPWLTRVNRKKEATHRR